MNNSDTSLRQTPTALRLLWKKIYTKTISGTEQLYCLVQSRPVQGLHHPHHELCAYIEAVKEVILRLLVLHEQLKILKHLQEKKTRNVRHTDKTALGTTKLYESRTVREPSNCFQGIVMMLDVTSQQTKTHLSMQCLCCRFLPSNRSPEPSMPSHPLDQNYSQET